MKKTNNNEKAINNAKNVQNAQDNAQNKATKGGKCGSRAKNCK